MNINNIACRNKPRAFLSEKKYSAVVVAIFVVLLIIFILIVRSYFFGKPEKDSIGNSKILEARRLLCYGSGGAVYA